MSLQVWRMLQKPLCGNQMNLATLTLHRSPMLRLVKLRPFQSAVKSYLKWRRPRG